MFKNIINGVTVIFSKFFGDPDSKAVLVAVPDGTKRCVFIDTPATPFLAPTVEALLARGVEVIVRDHHDEPTPANDRAKAIAAAAQKVRGLVGAGAVISHRAANPACSTLVAVGEFVGERTVIVADPDADGLCGALKALGVTYPELDADAAVLDGPHTGQTAATLSPLAFLLVQGLATLPPFDAGRPQVAEDAKSKLFDTFAKTVGGDVVARASLEKGVAEYQAQVAVARELAGTVQTVCTNVGLVDIRGKRPHIGTLGAELDKSYTVTVLLKSDGPIAKAHGVQYSLSVRKADQAGLNLQAILPSGFVSSPEAGIISNTSFLLHVSEKTWSEVVLPALIAKFGA